MQEPGKLQSYRQQGLADDSGVSPLAESNSTIFYLCVALLKAQGLRGAHWIRDMPTIGQESMLY